ncbi:MAG: cytochrome c [Marinobacterium sp.]|nr:cytochrome c [Marinobacterium sp.]
MPVSIIQAADDSAGVESENATAGHVAAIERGNYLLRAGGCYACHTDAADGGKPLAGGPGLHTEFGTFYAPNLTPDMEHGIGEWTLDQFRQALHKGLSPDGKPYYPVFPYDFYTRLNDQDVNDLWAALQAVPTSSTPDQQHDVSFPYSIRSGLSLWQSIFFREGRFRANPDNGEMFNRGAYLVNGPAHCAACHTPRNSYGALDWSRHLQGADNLPGGERSPTIRARVLKARGWTVESLARALKNGVQPAGDRFLGSMAEVVELGTSYLSEKDRRAIATYILTEPRRR